MEQIFWHAAGAAHQLSADYTVFVLECLFDMSNIVHNAFFVSTFLGIFHFFTSASASTIMLLSSFVININNPANIDINQHAMAVRKVAQDLKEVNSNRTIMQLQRDLSEHDHGIPFITSLYPDSCTIAGFDTFQTYMTCTHLKNFMENMQLRRSLKSLTSNITNPETKYRERHSLALEILAILGDNKIRYNNMRVSSSLIMRCDIFPEHKILKEQGYYNNDLIACSGLDAKYKAHKLVEERAEELKNIDLFTNSITVKKHYTYNEAPITVWFFPIHFKDPHLIIMSVLDNTRKNKKRMAQPAVTFLQHLETNEVDEDFDPGKVAQRIMQIWPK